MWIVDNCLLTIALFLYFYKFTVDMVTGLRKVSPISHIWNYDTSPLPLLLFFPAKKSIQLVIDFFRIDTKRC